MSCDDTHCVTCSDEGTPMRVLGAGSDGLASCIDEKGRWARVLTELVGSVQPDDLVLVHAGVALVRLDEQAVAA